MSSKSPLELPLQFSAHESLGLHPGEPVAQFEIGNFRNFVYLILDWPTKKAAILDPQEDLSQPLLALESHGFRLERVLLTHTHFDHVAGIQELIELFPSLPIHVHPLDQHRLKNKGAAVLNACVPTPDQNSISLGSIEIQALHTPGHSAGEISYFMNADGAKSGNCNYLFSGDTLFIRDCGRTDLETGSNEQMFGSLQRIKALDPNTILLPGHHYVKECASLLNRELQESPPLRCRSVQELQALP